MRQTHGIACARPCVHAWMLRLVIASCLVSALGFVPLASPPLSGMVGASPSVDARRDAGANELGVIPVLMYHGFTTDRALDDLWTRHVDDFRSDLQWLYDNEFHVISVRALIEHQIDVPLGKHPVVLTFDDSSFGQFFFEPNDAGSSCLPQPRRWASWRRSSASIPILASRRTSGSIQ